MGDIQNLVLVLRVRLWVPGERFTFLTQHKGVDLGFIVGIWMEIFFFFFTGKHTVVVHHIKGRPCALELLLFPLFASRPS